MIRGEIHLLDFDLLLEKFPKDLFFTGSKQVLLYQINNN